MRRIHLLSAACLLLCFQNACIYTDSEIYSIVPVAGDPAILTVTSNLDTLYIPPVGDSLLVNYGISIENGEFYFVEAIVSGVAVHSSDTTHGSFWLYPSMSDGIDTLQLDLYHSSNSNTLADVMGYESDITSRTYAIDFEGGGGK